MPKSRFHVLASFAVLVVAGVSVSASSAHAASSTTCTGSAAVSYSPGLKNTPQTINWTEADTFTCTSTDTSLTTGSGGLDVTSPGLSCSSSNVVSIPTHETPFEYTISWNNSQSSTMTMTDGDIETILGTEQATLVGTVTSGEFTGAAVTFVAIYPAPNPLACLSSPGLTSQSGTMIVEIIGT
jgi:hypothetical protein